MDKIFEAYKETINEAKNEFETELNTTKAGTYHVDVNGKYLHSGDFKNRAAAIKSAQGKNITARYYTPYYFNLDEVIKVFKDNLAEFKEYISSVKKSNYYTAIDNFFWKYYKGNMKRTESLGIFLGDKDSKKLLAYLKKI